MVAELVGADGRRRRFDPLDRREDLRTNAGRPNAGRSEWAGATVLSDEQAFHADATPEALYREVCALGGDRGRLVGDWLWALRDWLDRVVCGVGMRRGRRHPTEFRVGDVVDFWRVEALEPPWLVRFRAEMRFPGDAWLEWSITPEREGARLAQRARFRPRGLFGRAYRYAALPFQGLILGPLARIEQRARTVTGPIARDS